MPSKTKTARKTVRPVKRSTSRIQSGSTAAPVRKTRYALFPLILSAVGTYLLIYFGLFMNLSQSVQASLLASAGIESINANMWAFAGMLAIFLALVTFLMTEKWYDQKSFVSPKKEPAAFRETIVLFGVIGILLLLTIVGTLSQDLLGVSANWFLLFVILAAVAAVVAFLFVVRQNVRSMPSA